MEQRTRMRPLALAAALGAFAPWAAASMAGSAETVQILAINDLHGQLEPPAFPDGLVGQTPAGGAEYLATHLAAAASGNPNSILVGAGDLIGGSPLLSGLFGEAPTIEALNSMHMAVSSIGNHELDAGPDELLERIKTAHFQYLAANVLRTDGEKGVLLPRVTVLAVGGIKIGFIGETLRETAEVVPEAAVKKLEFLDESGPANEAAAQLEGQGVHAIILLLHQGGRQNPVTGVADPNGCVDLTPDFRALMRKMSPAIKVVISGHTHQSYNCKLDGRLVTSAGAYGQLFTKITLTVEIGTGRVTDAVAINQIVTRDVPKDPAQTAIIDKYRAAMAQSAERPVGSVGGPLSNRWNASGESELGDVIADAELESTKGPERGAAEIAFVNSGGIRTSIPGPSSGTRPVSYGELYAVQPFGNHLAVVTMSGDMIRQLLEAQFPASGFPNMLQVSDGFTYRYRLDALPGQHVVAGSIDLHGRPIEPSDPVRVAVPDFLAAGKDGFTIFLGATKTASGEADIEALMHYFGAHSPIRPGHAPRIVRVD